MYSFSTWSIPWQWVPLINYGWVKKTLPFLHVKKISALLFHLASLGSCLTSNCSHSFCCLLHCRPVTALSPPFSRLNLIDSVSFCTDSIVHLWSFLSYISLPFPIQVQPDFQECHTPIIPNLFNRNWRHCALHSLKKSYFLLWVVLQNWLQPSQQMSWRHSALTLCLVEGC